MKTTIMPNIRLSGTIWMLLCIGVSFFGVSFLQGWGDLCKDESYQTWAMLNWESSRLAPLSYWIGYKWMSVFGFKVINLRILTTIIGSLAVATSAVYSYFRTRNIFFCGFLLMLGAWVWRADAFMLYNWDSGSYLFDCLGLICAVEYFRHPSMKKIALCGTSCALMALGRLPSGIIVPLMCVLMFCHGEKHGISIRNNLYQIAVYCISFSIVFIGLLCLMYGNPLEYVNTINQGRVSGHSLSDSSRYIWRMNHLFKLFTFLYFPAFVCILFPLVFTKRLFIESKHDVSGICKKHWISITLMCVSVVTIALWTAKLFCDVGAECELGNSSPIVVALLLLPSVRNFANPGKPKMKMPIWQLWACGAIITAMIFGSDAYTERIEAGFTLPVIISILWTAKNRNVNNYLSVVVVLWLAGSIGVNAIHWNKQLKYCTYNYGDNLGIYEGLHTSEDYEKRITDLIPAIHKIKETRERYVLIDNRNILGLVLGQDNGPSYHEFGFYPTDPHSWDPAHLAMLDTIDAVVYRKEHFKNTLKVQQVVEILQKHGFKRPEEIGGTVVILRKL